MGAIVDNLVRGVLINGLRLIERAYPMPQRLGVPLTPDDRAPRTADPIVLVSGFDNLPSGWDEWKRSLVADGFEVHVFDMPSRGLGDLRDSAQHLAAYVDQVRASTGRAKIDVIGFSEGGLLARMVAGMHGRAPGIDRLISLATPHAGFTFGAAAYQRSKLLSGILDRFTPSIGQMLEGSALLGEIERGDAPLRAARDGMRYASIYSSSPDPVVRPDSSWLSGAVNIPVTGDGWGTKKAPSHFGMYHLSNRAYEAARILLLDQPDDRAIAAGGVLRGLAASRAAI